MPRLDKDTISVRFAREVSWQVSVDINDNNDLDVCGQCFIEHILDESDCCSHPDYNDDVYECAICGEELLEEIDGDPNP